MGLSHLHINSNDFFLIRNVSIQLRRLFTNNAKVIRWTGLFGLLGALP
ncbi:hypothetical protein LEP1GSC058_0867 [Leptospira fainei serovar Hurstbridge str. BUT 6]|uniref:Uncharacterized protein n=1 Tax=Leptospira fainei serovar Hurstbridge str. BUT 6 TaxID=1193011 RepID=S3UTN9_9LEPT|nr:hypothetical protein LEP1GSC058_0867 [Leptospira fainei serovar Hurstbridge str. BUT 6]